MTKEQIDFEDKHNKIIECCKFCYELKSKSDAVKKLIEIAGKTKPIKEILDKKKKVILKNKKT